jgi:hypothetical protein
MRILHAPRNIANQAWYVAAALRRMGHEAEVWELGDNTFGFPVDRTIPVVAHDSRPNWDAFLEALDRFDVFHFHFGRSFFPNQAGGLPPLWDLPVYRALGKRVFFTFHGSDCRIRSIHEEINPWSFYRYSDVPSDDDRTRKTIEIIRTYADRMFVVSADYLPFVPEATVMPRVIDLHDWPEQAPDQRSVPQIVHVPSMRGTKGTSFILDGLAALERAGSRFDLRLVEGVSHAEAQAAIRDADIVIDNVLTGDYELVSMEAMASSRVAVANIQERAAADEARSPVFSVDPSTFVERMRGLIEDPADRRRRAAHGRAWVAGRHDADLIAARLVEAYEGPSRRPGRSFPDWASLDDARRIERLESRIAALEQQLAAARRAAPDRASFTVGERTRSFARRVTPAGLRKALRRIARG